MENKISGMKVIFLDIDGVLNTEVFITAFWEFCRVQDMKRPEAKLLAREILRDDFGNRFDPLAVRMLAWVIEETGAKIVMSSTWRMSGIIVNKAMWRDRKLPGDLIDLTPIDMSEKSIRGDEIADWLSKNKVDNYVIIDDDKDMRPNQMNNFIKTHPMYGLTYTDAEKCIKILNSNE